jgi:hypothetical protein
MILATDMERHFEIVSNFRADYATGNALNRDENADGRLNLFKMLLKCSDLGHAAKPQEIHE